ADPAEGHQPQCADERLVQEGDREPDRQRRSRGVLSGARGSTSESASPMTVVPAERSESRDPVIPAHAVVIGSPLTRGRQLWDAASGPVPLTGITEAGEANS